MILLIGITLIGNFQPTQQYGLMLGYPDVYIKESKGITKCDDGLVHHIEAEQWQRNAGRILYGIYPADQHIPLGILERPK